jgi:hypothetical protein
MPQKSKSNQGPSARFRVHRQPSGGLRLTDESTDPDGEIIGRLWTTSTGVSRRGKVLLLQPGEVGNKVSVQLFVVDDHQATAVVTKELTMSARSSADVEERDVEPITPTPSPEEVGADPQPYEDFDIDEV